MSDIIHRLVGHVRWADQRLLDVLRAATNPPAEALRIYAHTLGAEHTWLSRLRQEPSHVAIWPTLTLDECTALARENADGLDAFVAGLSADDFDRAVAYRNSQGEPFETPIGEILVHVALHGQYHRGQVNLLLRGAGVEPSPVDYIAWVRGVPAASHPGGLRVSFLPDASSPGG